MFLSLMHLSILCNGTMQQKHTAKNQFQPIHNGVTPRHASRTCNCARGEYHSISKSAKQRCPDEELYIACIVTRVHSEPHLPFCITCSHTHSKQAFGTHLKTYLSMDSVAIYKGAFYTRSKFTLKVLAEYGCTFLLLWENFK